MSLFLEPLKLLNFLRLFILIWKLPISEPLPSRKKKLERQIKHIYKVCTIDCLVANLTLHVHMTITLLLFGFFLVIVHLLELSAENRGNKALLGLCNSWSSFCIRHTHTTVQKTTHKTTLTSVFSLPSPLKFTNTRFFSV